MHPNHVFRRTTLPKAQPGEQASNVADDVANALRAPEQADGWPGVIIPAVVIGIVVAYAQRRVN